MHADTQKHSQAYTSIRVYIRVCLCLCMCMRAYACACMCEWVGACTTKRENVYDNELVEKNRHEMDERIMRSIAGNMNNE